MSGQAHGHNDLPIAVATAGDSIERHTAAQVQLDHVIEWIEARQCAHLIREIRLYSKPYVQFDSIASLARVFDGSGIAANLFTVNGARHARCEADGIEFSACDIIRRTEEHTVML